MKLIVEVTNLSDQHAASIVRRVTEMVDDFRIEELSKPNREDRHSPRVSFEYKEEANPFVAREETTFSRYLNSTQKE